MKIYDDYEDYGKGGFQKISRKSKKHSKGHQSRHQQSESEMWAALVNNDPDTEENNNMVMPVAINISTPKEAVVPQRTFTFGPNTHTIKNAQIDFDRVANIEQVEAEHNGKRTFGIKFLFSGKKGLSRVIWFNTNRYERDVVFATEYKFWLSLSKK